MVRKIRGGAPETEIEHAKVLLDMGAPETWGWSTASGQERVRRRVEWISRKLNLKRGVRVLECGCGAGVFTREIAKTGAEVTAVDIANDLLEEAGRCCAVENVNFKNVNLESPDELEDGYFDAIYGVSVLHHLDLEVALPALLQKLKPGGHCVFSEPNLLNPINKFYLFVDDQEKRRKRGVSQHEMAFTRSELQRFIENANFEVISLEYRDFMHPSIPSVLIPAARIVEKILENTPGVCAVSGSLWAHMIRR